MAELTIQVTRAVTFRNHFGDDICSTKPFYNFGAGNWYHPDFQNIDLPPERYAGNRPDIEYDAASLKPLPIEENSALVFYFSHVNEHLPDDINMHLFNEVYRCLKPGGTVRFVYPDFDTAWQAAQDEDIDFFMHWQPHKWRETQAGYTFLQHFVKSFASRTLDDSPKDGNRKYSADELARLLAECGSVEDFAARITSNLCMKAQAASPGCHCNWWNHGKFERMLTKVGFSSVYKSAYLKSRLAPLRDIKFFDTKHPTMSGYTEAVK
ncbi:MULTISPECIES: methyltransferase domain-containing protein [Henriciella]|uniref:methyltransferase domain-containing protein n=1 Tax=Henriciella TaxID=453849 RepID=UPI003517C99D